MPERALEPYSSLRRASPMSASLSINFRAVLGQGPQWPVKLIMDRSKDFT
jgi:hypothetical protein